MAKRPRYKQLTLDGIPIEPPRPKQKASLMPLVFEDEPMRVVSDNNETWFSISDVCAIADVANAADVLRRLDDDEKRDDLDSIDVIGRRNLMWFVSEAGLYSVLTSFRLRKTNRNYEKIRRFRRWVTHEVLPSIRKTGSYSVQPSDRVAKMKKRLGCDTDTAKVRCDNSDTNKQAHTRLSRSKANRNHFRGYHNAVYRGEFDGRNCKDLKQVGGWNDTPLNHMDLVPLSINTVIKAIGERYIAEHNVPLSEQAAVMERIARETTAENVRRLGTDFSLGFTEHPTRGRILDVVRLALPSPC